MTTSPNFTPFAIGGTLTDCIYRVVTLKQKQPVLFCSPDTLEITLHRKDHRPAVDYVATAMPPARTVIGERVHMRFNSWQWAHDAVEKTLIEAAATGWEIISDQKCRHYFQDPVERVTSFLEAVASERRVVTYLEVEVNAGVHRHLEASRILETVSRASYAKNGTFLSSLVVNQEKGRPSGGFYNLVTDLTGIETTDLVDFWKQEVIKVWDAA